MGGEPGASDDPAPVAENAADDGESADADVDDGDASVDRADTDADEGTPAGDSARETPPDVAEAPDADAGTATDDAPEDAPGDEDEEPPGAGEATTAEGEASPDAAEAAADGDAATAEAAAGEHAGGDAADATTYEPSFNDAGDLDTYAARQGPAEDQEMPLTEHIEEMLKRLAVVVAIAGIVSLVTFPFAERLINFLWDSVLPAGDLTRPRVYGILELKLTELKVASLAGLIVALPVLVYETYQFMRPGLYPHERRYYLAAIPTSLVLALVGVSFAYFIVLPAIFTYFLYYSQDVATIGFALGRTFNLILLLMGYMAIVFQIPLFLLLAMMMGLVTRQWLADRRIIFWGAFLGISFVFSPDPTGMAPILVALTMIALFEGTLFLTRWTRRGRRRASS